MTLSRFSRTFAIVVLVTWAVGLPAAQSRVRADSVGPGSLSCSPAPCVLPPTQVSPGPNPDNDPAIVASPANPRDILVGSNSWNCSLYESLASYSSVNGGSSWSDACMHPVFFDGNTYSPDEGPILAYDRNGAAYIAGEYSDSNGDSAIAFEKSTDSIHWSDSGIALARSGDLPSYCWMAGDTNSGSPYVNSIYVSCVMVGPPFQFTQNQVVVSHSNDGGRTWHVVNVAPIQNSPEEDFNTAMAVGKDGTIYVTWMFCINAGVQACGDDKAYMVFSKSADGGNTWSEPTLIAKVTLIHPIPNTVGAVASNIPAIAVDASDRAYSGNLYVVMYNWTGTFMQVQVVRSTDDGDTWSKPTPVAPGITHDQFLPWIAVSPTGLVGVVWLDRRNDPTDTAYQAFAGISTDGGLSFQPNVQLTTAFSKIGTGWGGYDGATWDGANYFLAAWMDNSQTKYIQDYVGGIRLK